METYTFGFVIDRTPTHEELVAFTESGDMIFGTEGDLVIAEFDRTASDLVGAMSSAILELAFQGIRVIRMLNPEDVRGCTPGWRQVRHG